MIGRKISWVVSIGTDWGQFKQVEGDWAGSYRVEGSPMGNTVEQRRQDGVSL